MSTRVLFSGGSMRFGQPPSAVVIVRAVPPSAVVDISTFFLMGRVALPLAVVGISTFFLWVV